jgi:long-chain acyl-CoA synthetase
MTHLQSSHSNLYAALSSVAERHPDLTAIIFEGVRYSYAQLIERTGAAANFLRKHGIEKGDKVAVLSQNRPEFLFFYYATASLGAVFVPLNFNLTTEEVSYILQHSDAKLLLRDEMVTDLASLNLPGSFVHDIYTSFELEQDQQQGLTASLDQHDDLLICYTSGSTGTSKAVVIDHASQLNAAASFGKIWNLSSQDVTVLGAPLGFLLGLSTISTVSLLSGMTLVMVRRFHPGEILEALVEHDATIFNGVPTMFSMMLDFAQKQQRSFDLSGMRAIISSGSALPQELLSRFARTFGKELQDYFGMTEAYPLFARFFDDPVIPPPGAAGKIVPGAALRIVDQDGQECGVGISGELLVRAPSTIKRYHKNPELTAEALQDGWFRTGDIGLIDDQGFVFITGRLKELIKRGGANVAPAEVEAALLRHPMVEASAVVGIADSFFGEVPIAFVVASSVDQLTEDQLLLFLASVLAKYKIPSRVYFVPELPLGKTGKVDKAELRRLSQKLTTSVTA